jgi:hypothetical protein
MSRIDKTKFDITRTNDAIDRLLAVTTNLRHRFLLQTFYRHRFLEIAGRYEEIFAPEMTVDAPVYHFNYAGIVTKLTGATAVKGLYGMWAQTHQSIFYVEKEQIAVADDYIASVATAYQQVLGKALAANGIKVDDENAYYLYKTHGVQQVWPYGRRRRLGDGAGIRRSHQTGPGGRRDHGAGREAPESADPAVAVVRRSGAGQGARRSVADPRNARTCGIDVSWGMWRHTLTVSLAGRTAASRLQCLQCPIQTRGGGNLARRVFPEGR